MKPNIFLTKIKHKIKKQKLGFTIVELMVSLAIVVTLLSSLFILNFRISSNWATEKARSELEQNFRFAIDTISTDLRSSSTNPDIFVYSTYCSGDTYREDIVMIPEDNHLTTDLKFKVYKYDEATASYKIFQHKYYLDAGSKPGTSKIMIKKYKQSDDCNSTMLQEVTTQPITEEVKSLAALYFARRGNKLIVIIVGRFSVFGKTKTVSYTSEILIRNMAPRP